MDPLHDDYVAKKSVDDYLNEVDYRVLNSNSTYIPSEFSLKFMNFIKLVNGSEGEGSKTPVMHLAMLDKLATRHQKIANLCARGTAKTTLFMEYLVLYLGVFGVLPNFGEVSGILYISDSMENGVNSARKSIQFRYENSDYLQYWIPEATFIEKEILFKNRSGHRVLTRMFGSKSGIRGQKMFGKRPTLAIMDDLLSDADSKSKVSMEAVKDTVYSGAEYALDPKRQKMILNGTPFNKQDIVYQAIESGSWQVNVWPICEEFPCSREDFRGAWEDRFDYDFVKNKYDSAVKQGTLNNFRQELMLRITSDESRLVQDGDIKWTERSKVLANKHLYNFYITTDFATSSKQTADYSVIYVWAYSAEGNWIWIDGICERQTMDKTINALFRLIQEYDPQSVGIEINGQQGGNIQWLMSEMEHRDCYFGLTNHNGKPGIRVVQDKLSRFNMVVPLFKAGKIFLPLEMKATKIISILLGQIALTTIDGIKGMDDCIDTISMLQNMQAWVPGGVVSGSHVPKTRENEVFEESGLISNQYDDDSNYSSYI